MKINKSIEIYQSGEIECCDLDSMICYGRAYIAIMVDKGYLL